MPQSLLFPDREFAAFLFDMDGTVLTSIVASERVWGVWARRHGLDVEAVFKCIHGRRAVETVRSFNIPDVDEDAEVRWLMEAEIADTDGIDAIEGAAAFLSALPADRWAVVTSAPRALAKVRLAAAGLPIPAVLVTAEDVERGKPAPDCFLLAAQRLSHAIEDCLVFEDAPAGIAAAEAAGAKVVVITATHSHPLETPHPGVMGYGSLRVTASGALSF
ncbi:HAD-IA family hydrolase [Caulobacter sp.]|uniref:HAD-IA family hydrolase n=1 Tax=Caulobacter sp. TaxID=78 RepID=UPI002B47F0A2|nr:HAD-IA family hydrolase [Caulobacter sp.]HJV42919.1 HAD-IA family hydrolase [Caulobacter sp.]